VRPPTQRPVNTAGHADRRRSFTSSPGDHLIASDRRSSLFRGSRVRSSSIVRSLDSCPVRRTYHQSRDDTEGNNSLTISV
jgi:hypothetical protein